VEYLKQAFQSINYISTTVDISTKHKSFIGVTTYWVKKINNKKINNLF